jgi:ribose/xylose/arabinose/galactoside ABC-type transport system permease subunit
MPKLMSNSTQSLDWLRLNGRSLLNIYTAAILLIIVASILSPSFLSSTNIFNVLRQASALGIISVGMTYVILSGNGGVDLSVGAMVSLTTCLAAGIMMGQTSNIVPALIVVILAGTAVGLFNGLLITRFATDPFITTLGTMTVVQGIAMYYTKGSPFGGVPAEFRFIAEGYVGFVPVPVIIFLFIFLIGLWVMRKTIFGRYIYAIGGNQEVARLSGIKVNKYKIAVYVISSLLATIAGLILVARVSLGDPRLGYGYELDAIAAVIIGGTSFAGGIGGMGGTIIGVLIIAIMNNLLNLMDVSPFLHGVVKGLIILAAIIMQRKR